MLNTGALGAVAGTELRLRFRNPSFSLLIAVTIAACALLVPEPTASYTTVTVNGRRLLMSADTSLTAAGVVLGILLLPVFALAFDVGHTRDARHGLDRLHLTTPVRAQAIAWGRLLANMLAVLGVIVLALLVISSTLYARSLGTPSSSAMVVFLLIVVPVGIAAVALGALLDRYLGQWTGRRTAVAFACWMAAMVASAFGAADVFGVSYLRQVIVSGGHPKSLSVGAVSTSGLDAMSWTYAPITSALVASRLMLVAVFAVVIALLAVAIRLRLRTARDVAWGLAVVSPEAMPPRDVALPRLVNRRASVGASLYLVVRRWLARSRLAVALIAATLVLSTSGSASAAIALVLLIPAVIVSEISTREVQVADTLEATTSALVRPTPTLTYCWMLALVVLLPVLPALARTHATQALTAVLGLVAATLWLTFTHRCAERPVLGTATFAAVWYLSVFNHPPPSMDVFGLWGGSAQALAWSAAAVAGTLALVVRHDRA